MCNSWGIAVGAIVGVLVPAPVVVLGFWLERKVWFIAWRIIPLEYLLELDVGVLVGNLAGVLLLVL